MKSFMIIYAKQTVFFILLMNFTFLVDCNFSQKFKFEVCPEICKCYRIKNKILSNLRQVEEKNFINVTACQRENLTDIPTNISTLTSNLYLENNKLTQLSYSTFQNLTLLQVIGVANNKIRFFAANTFHHLTRLTSLDLRKNQLRTLPEKIFCPWSPLSLNLSCTVPNTKNNLTVFLSGNPWICSCSLQTFIHQQSCEFEPKSLNCIKLKAAPNNPNDIGYCDTMDKTIHIPLNRLSGNDAPANNLQLDTCYPRYGHIDYVLLLVMCTWMGLTVLYVLHFVSWNNKEIARHKSYISSLKTSQENQDKTSSTKMKREDRPTEKLQTRNTSTVNTPAKRVPSCSNESIIRIS